MIYRGNHRLVPNVGGKKIALCATLGKTFFVIFQCRTIEKLEKTAFYMYSTLA